MGNVLTKCKSMSITKKHVPINYIYNINLVDLEVVGNFTYLGIVIAKDFSWNKHVNVCASKARRRLGNVKHTLWYNVSSNVKHLCYSSMVRKHA